MEHLLAIFQLASLIVSVLVDPHHGPEQVVRRICRPARDFMWGLEFPQQYRPSTRTCDAPFGRFPKNGSISCIRSSEYIVYSPLRIYLSPRCRR